MLYQDHIVIPIKQIYGTELISSSVYLFTYTSSGLHVYLHQPWKSKDALKHKLDKRHLNILA